MKVALFATCVGAVRHQHPMNASRFGTAGDASCLLNIGGSLRKRDSGAKALHIAEILASTKRRPHGGDAR